MKCPAVRHAKKPATGSPAGAGSLAAGGAGGTGSAGSTPGQPLLSAARCFEDPGASAEATSKIEACGYPGFNNTGVEAGVSLKSETGTVVFTSSGWENTATKEKGTGNWEGRRLQGEVLIEADARPATLKNDEVFDEGKCHKELCSVNPIDFVSGEAGPSGFVFSHLRVGGGASTGENVAQTCINDPGSGTYTAEYVKAIYCSGFKLNGGGELNHVFCPSDYEISGEHYECVTDQGDPLSSQPLKIEDSTIFQPPPANFGEGAGNGAGPTAAVFLQSEYGSVGELILEGDFLAGGAEAIMDESKAAETKLTVRRTRFARCLAASCEKVPHEELNGSGVGDGTHLQQIRGNSGDGHGWFERVGLYGILYPISGPAPTWQENFYDDDLSAVSLKEAE